MKTHSLKTILILFISVSGLFSCTDWLDVKPESQIILENYWKSETDVQSVLMSCYKSLTTDANVYRMIVWGELRSDNLTTGASFPKERFDMYKILTGDLTPNNAYAAWGSFYNTINYCNTVLYYAPYVVDRDNNFTTDDLNRVLAEAKAVRALAYFYLVRSFRDVPFVTNASIDDSQEYSIAKTDGHVILDSLISDLTFARKYAITEFGSKSQNKGRFTLNGVNALLADIYLWQSSDKEHFDDAKQKEYLNKCIETCDLVMADTKLKLIDGSIMYSQVFSIKNSNESILELQFEDEQQVNNPVNELYGDYGDNLGELSFPTTLGYDYISKTANANSPFGYSLTPTTFESRNDIRARDFLNVNIGRSTGKYYIFKYGGRVVYEGISSNTTTVLNYSYRTNTANWIIYRLSDIYLMKAEALAQFDEEEKLKNAVACANYTYIRSNETADSLNFANYGSKPEVEKLVLRERQRELMFEGKRWFDLVRLARREMSINSLNNYVNHKSTGQTATSTAQTLDAMYMPISNSELEANPKLEQNPYYKQGSGTSER